MQIVIARFNEDLEWLKDNRFEGHSVICYNKGPNDNFYKHPNMEIVHLPNVGMCNHTYLYHFITHYDDLADVTICLPGSCMDANKINATNWTINRALQTKDSVFTISVMPDVRRTIANFVLDYWKVSNSQNMTHNADGALVPCSIRPFGAFYTYYFGDLRTVGVNYFSIYAVSKAHVRQTPKALFEELILHVDKYVNCEAAHYLERCALAMFHPIPYHCLFAV